MILDRAGIESCIPHSGSMVLLDAVVQWDAASIICSAGAPGDEHPLVRDGTVAALVAVEYGAQAAAVHGFLVEPAVPRPGMLAKLSDVHLHAAFIPANQGSLSVKAQLLSRVAQGCLYDFHLACGSLLVAHGRLMVAFAALTKQ